MTDNRTTELLPCPICGGQPDFQHFNITPNVRGRIICACGLSLVQGKNDTDDDMRIIWNTRSDYAVQAANERKAEQVIAATLGSESVDYMLNTIGKLEEENEHLRSSNAELEQINAEYMDANHDQGMQLIEYHKRITELESLVKDVWAAYSAKAESSFHPVWEVDDELAERMTALGLLDGDAI